MPARQGPPEAPRQKQHAQTVIAPDPDGRASPQRDGRQEETAPVPRGNWTATAQRLLEAAQRLLARSGFNALSLEKVAREAGVNKPLIFYYFGNKAGLLRALMDSVLQKDLETLRLMYAALPEGEARIHAVVEYSRKAAADRATNQVFFDTAVNMLRHTRDRARLAEWCATCRRQNIWGLSGNEEQEATEDIRALSAMTLALQDGLALQILAEPGAVDTEHIWALWEEFLGVVGRHPAP
ncbi:MAG: TetR/AcrR family transcriptional regulator [Actinomycetia bacterium]|nr:TetR/AcrR family transcriptional regulator [Actinomycetes bacterium]